MRTKPKETTWGIFADYHRQDLAAAAKKWRIAAARKLERIWQGWPVA